MRWAPCDGHHLSMMGIGSPQRRPSDDDRVFFEALVVMRDRYTARGRDDRQPVTNLHHAIAIADAAMRATDHRETRRLGTADH